MTVRPQSSLWRIQDVVEWVEAVPAAGPLPRARLIFHLAAAGVRPGEDVAEMLECNVLGTMQLLEHARASEVERFVHCGSCFEYGPGARIPEGASLRPISEYGASKAAGSLLALAYGTAHGVTVAVVRPFTAYGPLEAAHRLVPSTIVDALEGGPVRIGSGGHMRDFVHVDDVVDGLLAAARSADAAGETFNLCTGVGTSVLQVAELVAELAGGVEVVVGAVEDRPVDFRELSGDPTRAGNTLGWRAQTELSSGLRATMEWLHEHRDRHAEYAREKTAQ